MTEQAKLPRKAGGKSHIATLDGLRGTVALLVTFSHANFYGWGIRPGLYFGTFAVTVFFTLSGFLMAYLHLAQAPNRGNLFHYIVNRAARIAPLYLLIIIASFLIVKFVDPGFAYQITAHNLPRHLLFAGSTAVFWSIPPEIQFYAFFLIVWLALSQAGQRKYALAALVLLAIIGMAVIAPHCPGTSLPTKIWLFMAGCVAGYLRQRQKAGLPWPFALPVLQTVFLGGTLGYCRHLFFAAPTAEGVYQSFLYALICGLLVFLVSQPTALASGVFSNHAIRSIGKWSFALYLLHEPAFYLTDKTLGKSGLPDLALNAVAIGLAIALACAAHYAIERPGQKLVRRHGGHLLAFLTARFAPA